MTYKVLAQAQGTVAGQVVYTVPTAFSTVTSTMTVCNTSNTDITVRLAVSSSSIPTDAEWLLYDTTVLANDLLTLTLGLTLEAGKRIWFSSSSVTSAIGVFGLEQSI